MVVAVADVPDDRRLQAGAGDQPAGMRDRAGELGQRHARVGANIASTEVGVLRGEQRVVAPLHSSCAGRHALERRRSRADSAARSRVAATSPSTPSSAAAELEEEVDVGGRRVPRSALTVAIVEASTSSQR